MNIGILTDSGSAIQVEEAKNLGIYVVPLQVIDGTNSYLDGIDMNIETLYDCLKHHHVLKTSMPSIAMIQDVMKKMKADGVDAVISIPLSSGLSSTYQTIELCGKELSLPVITIETNTTCQLQGYLVKLAKKALDEGKNLEEVVSLLNRKIQTSGTFILPNDLQHLKRGGRLTPIAAATASLLKIRPILHINSQTCGKIDILDKVRTEKKAVHYVLDMICKIMSGKQGKIYVIHADCEEKAKAIKQQIEEREPHISVEIHRIGVVISAHTGLDCIAIQYIEE